MNKQIRTLPPGLDTLEQEATFGTLWIQIGTIKLIRSTNASYNVLCQFWGQNSPAVLATRSDTANNQQQRIQKYNIKCPITFFAEYLHQMKNNLRLEVQNVGKISLDITKFLKKNLNIDSRQAFQHFKGFFQIIGKGNRKAGSLQVQMGCQFDPEIAIRQMGESAIQQIRKSQIQKCPVSKLQVFQCCGHCQCICSRSLKKVNKQTIVKQQPKTKDNRIAHSLDTRPRQQNQFNANKYIQKQEENKKLQHRVNKKEIEQKSKHTQTIKSNKISEKIQQFPEVPKILTYSNLRLNFDDPQLQQEIKKQNQQLGFPNMQKKNTFNQQPYHPHPNKNDIADSVEQKIQIKSKPKITKQELLKQFYGAENSPFKLNEQLQNAIDDSYHKSFEKQAKEREKLSKVINLNEEFQKQSRIRAPPMLIDNILQKSDTMNENYQKIGILKRPNKKSSLMLSLFIEIDKNKINLPLNEKIIIVYRPYGQKERLTIGPNFADPIHILSNVGQNQVKRMNKTPFIIQFWTSAQNKFIGLIRIDLSKIKKGFILQDQLNQIAIKTNLLPTVIHRGPIRIIDLSDKQIGMCELYAGIGTSNQLNTYLNQKQSEFKAKPNPDPSTVVNKKIEDPQKQLLRPADKKQQKLEQDKHEHSLDNRHLLGSFDIFLEKLYKNNNHIIQTVNKMMNQRYIDRLELNELGKIVGIQSLNIIFDLHTQIKNNQIEQKANKQTIDFHQIADSFDDFIEIMQKIREEFSVCGKTVKNLFEDPSAVLQRIKQQTPMQLINKKKLLQIMQKFTKYSHPITQLLNKLNQYVNIDLISLILSNRSFQIPQLIHINKQYINQLLTKRLVQTITSKGFTIQSLLHQFQDYSTISVFQFVKWVYKMGFGGSLWAILHLLQPLHNNSHFQANKVKTQELSAYFQSLIDRKAPQIEIKKPQQEKQIKQQNPKLQEQELPKKKSQEIENEPKPPEQRGNINQPQNSQNASLNNMLDNLQKNQQPNKQQKKQKIYKHLYSINPVELSLDNPIKGNCVVIYEFPFDEEQVKSKNFILSIDKHKYPLKMYGNHGFTIEESPQSYLGDNSLKFYVKIDKRIEYEGALPSDELLMEPNTQEDKIIPLFSDRSEGIAGKIRLNIHFQRALATQNALSKQTTYQLFLPKSGYINYSITSQIQTNKIRSQLNLKEQFYIALVFDLFHHNSTLRTQFPPFSSKLYSDSSDTAEIRGSIKISLSPVILQYLKSNTGRLSLNIIYYSKENGNFQRKQVPYAAIQLPLINIIKTEGIKGDYAFKNKLGMFVTLANCVLKYDKEPMNKLAGKEQNDKGMTAYWLILNFLELISFQSHKFTWIKIEFVLKGRKYSTEKLQLEPFSVNFLNNSAILVKFTHEDFIDTKVIPVTIITNTSEKLGIDINVKAFSKDITHKKYSINNQYFIVVNQSSRATKMRMGVKTYCFRGGPLLSNFVNALYQHLDTEVFQEMQLPKNIQNYDQMLNIFKNRLKLSQKGLQQALSQLEANKGKQKLNFEFFTNRTYYKLDFTPILAQTEADIDFICEQLETQSTKQQILQYIQDNKIKLQNFRPEFLQRFSFKELNKIKADKNVDFLSIDSCIDLISFIRKIKILEQEQSSSMINQTAFEQKILQVTILEGSNFQKLYNGIKPNSIVRIPQLGLQTQVSHRNSSPYFNETSEYQLEKQNLILLRNLKIEIFHCTNDEDDAENILIGQGYININPLDIKNAHKIIKVTLTSLMSNRLKANLNIKLGFVEGRRNRSKQQNSSRQIEQSAQASRIGEILHDIRQEMAYKNKLFQSSDEEY